MRSMNRSTTPYITWDEVTYVREWSSTVILLLAVESIWRVRITEQALLAMCCYLYLASTETLVSKANLVRSDTAEVRITEPSRLRMCCLGGENMNYSNMITTEDTDNMYDNWADYRQKLTSYILGALEEGCSKGSWVAIWGAGGCNDIDIKKLLKSYRLLLIDRDVEKLQAARERLGVGSDICKVADVDFWSISDEDYEMFEALIMDGASLQEIEAFFQDLTCNMTEAINLKGYSVDCSVVVGLASQLNARFAGLLHLHKNHIPHIDMLEIKAILDNLNQLATERLLISVRQLTKSLIITGYEAVACYNKDELEANRQGLLNTFYTGANGGSFLSINQEENSYIRVAGNEFWHGQISKALCIDKLEDMGRCQLLDWNFSPEKTYVMLMLSLAIT